MKNRYGQLQKIGAAGLTALLLCCTFPAGCGRQEKTGNLSESPSTSEETEGTTPGSDTEDFRYDPGAALGSIPSDGEESQPEKEDRCFLILQTSIADPWLTDAAAAFNRQNDRYTIRIEESGTGESLRTCRDRMLIDLTAGRGPDIFIGDVFPGINESVLEKGILMDLALLLDAAGITDEKYFPAVRALTMDEHVYGINTTIYPTGYWVLESVLGGREQPDFETLVDKLYSYPDQKAVWRQHMPYYLLLDFFLGGSEDLWGMIDWEAGQCDFSGELFAKILQITQRYADPDGTGQTAIAGWYDAGQVSREEVESEGKVILDYPFDDGWYPYCNIYDVIMINANTKYPEGAFEFIKYLLGANGQNYVAKYYTGMGRLPANKDMADSCAEDLLKQYEEGHLQMNIMKGDTLVEYIPTEELAEELKDYANRARYLPLKTREIRSIILEEAAMFFSGDKTLDAVRDIIQNRVQLYLDENR